MVAAEELGLVYIINAIAWSLHLIQKNTRKLEC
jgi:hypothetical protein